MLKRGLQALGFVGTTIAGAVINDAYTKSKELYQDKDLELELKQKRLEAQILENELTIKRQEELIRAQRGHIDSNHDTIQSQYKWMDEIKDKTEY